MIRIEKYKKEKKDVWDEFVLNQSCNGTFLQTRNFLEYHEDKFHENSLFFLDNEKIIAVLPAHIYSKNGFKQFMSHQGSTYGGLVINCKYYKARKVQEVLDCLDNYAKENSINEIVLKITPKLFCTKKPDLLQYMLTLNGYENFGELSTYVDLAKTNEDILLSFDETKRKIVRRLRKNDITLKKLVSDEDIYNFCTLLELNLKKHNAMPIHSYENLLDFKNSRLTNNVEFFGVFIDDKMCAAGMMFLFNKLKIAHAQNLSTDPNSPYADSITYLYYSMIEEYKKRDFDYVSWGKSTEDRGKILNFNLLRNKEAYGSDYDLNYTYFKIIK